MPARTRTRTPVNLWRSKTVAVPYVGPGDLGIASVFLWGGLRAYSAAYATALGNAVDLLDQAGANPITIGVLVNGQLDAASITTWVAAHSVSTIKVTKLYDQTGNNNHLTQSTLANMPTLVSTAIGSGTFFVLTYASSGPQSLQTGVLGAGILPQPYSSSSVAIRTSNFGNQMPIFQSANQSIGNYFTGSGNGTYLFAGNSSATVTQTDNTWHSFNAVFSNLASVLDVDGSTTSALNAGNGTIGNERLDIGSGGAGSMDGKQTEFGLWSLGFSAPNISALELNQHAFYGAF